MTKNQKYYRSRQERLRQEAIEYQIDCYTGEIQLSYSELAEWCNYFRKYGKRFGLLREFEENAIL